MQASAACCLSSPRAAQARQRNASGLDTHEGHATCSCTHSASPSNSTAWCVQASLSSHLLTSSQSGHPAPTFQPDVSIRGRAHLPPRPDRVVPDDQLHARVRGRQARLQLQQLRLPRLARYAAWPPRSRALVPVLASNRQEQVALLHAGQAVIHAVEPTLEVNSAVPRPQPCRNRIGRPGRTWVAGPGRGLVLRHAGAGVDKEYVRGAAEQAQAVPALAVPPRVARCEPHVQLRARRLERQAVLEAAEPLATGLASAHRMHFSAAHQRCRKRGRYKQGGAAGRARLVQRAVAASGLVAVALGRQRHAARVGPQLPIVMVAQDRVPGDCAAPAASAARRGGLGHVLMEAWRLSRTFNWCAAAHCAPCRLAEL